MAKTKNINERCPFQKECGRLKCEFKNSEEMCNYYWGNSFPGNEIEGQASDNLPIDGYELEDFEKGELVYLPIESLLPHPDNPRKDLGDLTELADSIKANGVMQNLTVVPFKSKTNPDFNGEGKYTIVIGHRRHAAAEIAGLTELPCIIKDMTPKEQVATMLSENMQRNNLTIYEQAQGFQMMLDLGETQSGIAEQTGFSKTTVARRLKLLSLNKSKFKEAEVRGGTIDDYLKVAEIKDPKERDRATDAIGTNNFDYTVRTALRKQEFKEKEPIIKTVMKRLGIKRDDSIRSWDSKYERVTSVRLADFSEDYLDVLIKEGVQLWWNIESETTLYIYKKAEKKKKEPVKKSPKEIVAIERRKQLEAITETAFQLRKAFVESFSATTKYADILNEWAFDLLKRRLTGDYASYNIKWLCTVIGEEYFKNKYCCDSDLIEKFTLSSPSSKAIILAVFSGDNENLGYYTSNYGEILPTHTNNKTLDFIYKYLCALGYQLSDEEKALQDGTHELFVCEESEASE